MRNSPNPIVLDSATFRILRGVNLDYREKIAKKKFFFFTRAIDG